MRTVAGIFKTREDANRAVENLRLAGVTNEQITVLAPGATEGQVDRAVPTTETEQPGMGKALGGVVGGAMGAAGGATLGAAAASLFIPGVGPVLAAGIIGAALLGAGGAAAGAAGGGSLEDSMATGLPHDELYVYEDALRQGRTVIIVVADTDEQGDAARSVLGQSGAESLDAARESWWVGMRDAEAEEYTGQGGDFTSDESIYRRGFEASLHPMARNASFDEARANLRERHGDVYDADAFRRGYERGRAYHQELREKYKG